MEISDSNIMRDMSPGSPAWGKCQFAYQVVSQLGQLDQQSQDELSSNKIITFCHNHLYN